MRLFAAWLDRDDYRQEAQIARWQGRNVKLHLIDVTKAATARKHKVVSEAVREWDAPSGRSALDVVLEREELTEAVRLVQTLPDPASERRNVGRDRRGGGFDGEAG